MTSFIPLLNTIGHGVHTRSRRARLIVLSSSFCFTSHIAEVKALLGAGSFFVKAFSVFSATTETRYPSCIPPHYLHTSVKHLTSRLFLFSAFLGKHHGLCIAARLSPALGRISFVSLFCRQWHERQQLESNPRAEFVLYIRTRPRNMDQDKKEQGLDISILVLHTRRYHYGFP